MCRPSHYHDRITTASPGSAHSKLLFCRTICSAYYTSTLNGLLVPFSSILQSYVSQTKKHDKRGGVLPMSTASTRGQFFSHPTCHTWKVCLILVNIYFVYHNARLHEQKRNNIATLNHDLNSHQHVQNIRISKVVHVVSCNTTRAAKNK